MVLVVILPLIAGRFIPLINACMVLGLFQEQSGPAVGACNGGVVASVGRLLGGNWG